MSTEVPTLYCWSTMHPYELMDVCPASIDESTGKYIISGPYKTSDAPPQPKTGFAICRNMDKNCWEYVEDHRGKKYWTTDMNWQDQGIPVLYPGPLPVGAVTTPPPKPADIVRQELYRAIIERAKMMIRQGVLIDGIKFDADHKAVTAYMSFLKTNETDPYVTQHWKASDDGYKGVWVTMTINLCTRVLAAATKHIDACFHWQQKTIERLHNTPDQLLHEFNY